jgi:Rrf2 family protein
MKMNEGVEWAVHACCLLAPLGPDRGLSLAALAEYHGVPAPYMAKQMQALSKAGIVRTSRGASGGYALARGADAITLLDVVRAADGAAPMFRCTEIRQRGPCALARTDCATPCGIARAFAAAEAAWRAALAEVTIAGLVATVGQTGSLTRLGEIMQWYGTAMRVLPSAS